MLAWRMLERAISLTSTTYVRSVPTPCLHPRRQPRPRGYLRVRAGQVRLPFAISATQLRLVKLEDDGVVLRDNYCAERNGAYWDRRPVVTTARLVEIGSVLGLWFVRAFLAKDKDAVASSLRGVLTSLGPAFVKIGQVASSRPDVVPPVYLRELEKLQDRIPPFGNAEAFALIEKELAAPIEEVFSSLSPEPVAAASLGQVYKARLKASQQEVAVKVQRPDVVEQIALDVYLLRRLAGFVRKWKKINSNLPLLIDEWASSLFKEVDYERSTAASHFTQKDSIFREAANGARFKQLFGQMKGVYVPEMYFQWTTSKILVMEWVDGQKLRSGATAKRISRGSQEDLRLVDVGVRCSLEQMLEEGFYHADPHPGNLMKLPSGLLCYIDFGMMGQINKETQQALIRATLHLINREYEALAEDFVSLGMLPSASDRSRIIPALTGVFQSIMMDGMNNLSFGDFSEKLGTTMYQYKFQIPPYYTLLVRSLTVLEGIALASDPSYKVLSAAYPWVARRLLSDKSPELRQTLRALLYKRGTFQFDRLEALLLQAVRSPGKAESFHSGTWSQGDLSRETSVMTRPLQFLLKEEGVFVRDILLDEIAKGIDAAWRLSVDDWIQSTKNNVLSGLTNGSPSLQSFWSQMLTSVPVFSEDKDREQIAGLQRLSQAMQQIEQRDRQTVNTSTLRTISQASSALTWILNEIRSLNAADRDEALKIPMILASKLSSRVLARALRQTLGVLNQKPRTSIEKRDMVPATSDSV